MMISVIFVSAILKRRTLTFRNARFAGHWTVRTQATGPLTRDYRDRSVFDPRTPSLSARRGRFAICGVSSVAFSKFFFLTWANADLNSMNEIASAFSVSSDIFSAYDLARAESSTSTASATSIHARFRAVGSTGVERCWAGGEKEMIPRMSSKIFMTDVRDSSFKEKYS